MRAEKQIINKEYLDRLQHSPFFIVLEYSGLKVGPITELRRRLGHAHAEMHVVKNSLFRLAAQEAGLGDLGGALTGQLAVVTGQGEIAATAKVIKNFHAEFDRPRIKFGFMGDDRLDQSAVAMLADLPPMNQLRGILLGVIKMPATRLAQMLQTPAAQLVRVLQAKVDKG